MEPSPWLDVGANLFSSVGTVGAFAVAMYLFGAPPAGVSATGGSFLQTERGIEDVVFSTLTWADGRMAHVHVSWIDAEKRRALTIVGSKGTITIDGTAPVTGGEEPLRAAERDVDADINKLQPASRQLFMKMSYAFQR